ncbi:AAA family ATPase [Mumia qirimensis]|uniref:AAA family ATPase n=1 Tax=Mumia qirimensis TaxID=3234852 RepID=UPI00351CDDFA
MQWFGEFQIDLRDRSNVRSLFRDPSRSIEISASMSLAAEERQYLDEEAEALIEPVVWRGLLGPQFDEYRNHQTALATLYRQHGERANQEIATKSALLREGLQQTVHNLSLSIAPDGRLGPGHSLVAEVLFQTYSPEKLGIIDFHGASRNYARETLGGVNVNLHDSSDSRREMSLYNLQGKYSNIKTELAGAYIRDLIARDAGTVPEGDSGLDSTLQELFRTFFPDKEYLGVRPESSGGLRFSVRTVDGASHDINDLSSGEKEVLYGYLRLRSTTPRHSMILIDEPELHLNPALLRGFPDFYHRNIGRARDNQLWLVTHSDTLLRQAVGNANYNLFHMTPATAVGDVAENQAAEILADDQLDTAIVSLVGDLAMYRPNAKVAIFEGGGGSDFDVTVVTRLFPKFAQRVNCVSGGSKRRVRDLYGVLAETAKGAGLADKFYAIVDRDSDHERSGLEEGHALEWDAYHIENYFLSPTYLRRALVTLGSAGHFADDAAVASALEDTAREVVDTLVMEILRQDLNAEIRRAINLGGRPGDVDPVTAIEPALAGTWQRLADIRTALDTEQLRERIANYRESLEVSFEKQSWSVDMPGRSILKRFVDRYLDGKAEYSAFMGVVLDKMADDNYQPPGMLRVIEQILSPDLTEHSEPRIHGSEQLAP